MVKPPRKRVCAVSGGEYEEQEMLCFVLAPNGSIVFDVSAKLPSESEVWLEASAWKNEALRDVFSQAFPSTSIELDGLRQAVQKALLQRLSSWLSLANKSGNVIAGFSKVEAALKSGKKGLVFQAADGAEDGRAKLSRLADALGVPSVALLDRETLGEVIGREDAVHLFVTQSKILKKIQEEMRRLTRFC